MSRPFMVRTQGFSRLFDASEERSVVEIKWPGEIGAPDVRSFLGGRDPQGSGLYVCTGGFTRKASEELERADISTALMGPDDLVKSLLEQCDMLDLETQQLAPPKRILVPAWA
ncbi:Restriction endonuclease [Rhizobium sp. RU35A]|uniref:restriction endonuclease n=1 Tax=Rhizobium sp. RU35A TaxID=1907414 RepID=UPI000956D531|nr:restriction endonuclease [Rhizobium sp. RU35A]SIR37668.1 Restriction endonuclease [Rhizobium sp. RU35A]